MAFFIINVIIIKYNNIESHCCECSFMSNILSFQLNKTNYDLCKNYENVIC